VAAPFGVVGKAEHSAARPSPDCVIYGSLNGESLLTGMGIRFRDRAPAREPVASTT